MANDRKFQEVYRIGEIMGDGAFGEVRWCIQRETKIRRAVKICRKDLIVTEEQKQKMLNEIEVLKIMDHPNIIRAYEFFED